MIFGIFWPIQCIFGDWFRGPGSRSACEEFNRLLISRSLEGTAVNTLCWTLRVRVWNGHVNSLTFSVFAHTQEVKTPRHECVCVCVCTHTSIVRSLRKSLCSGFSTSTTPHGYRRPRIFFPFTSISWLEPITANGMLACTQTHSFNFNQSLREVRQCW